jgi:F-type H+-transporting ATPase subunit a
MEHGFTWIGNLSHLGVPEVILTSLFVSSLLVVFALIANRRLASAAASNEPEDGFTVRNVAEAFVEGMQGLAEGVIGHGAEKYVPLLATFFAFILVSNLLGLVPGFVPPTSDFNITFGLGLVSFAAYNYYGARAHGAGYVKQFLGPMLLLAPLMLLVEIFSHAFRPISLGIRLFANIFADHQVVSIFTDLTKVGVPVIFYLLGTFVAVVQAFVFTMLTAIYIALAISHDH